MNYEWKSMSLDKKHEYQEKSRLVIDNWKQKQDMHTIGIDETEKQCLLTLYLYPKHLFYLACGSSHLYGLKLLSLHSKLS
jgi:hypothetical protein